MSDAKLLELIVGDHRPPENIARNTHRHPAETLAFFGLRPDMTVLEMLPARGWYTEILAPYLAESGQLRVAHFSPNGREKYMPPVLELFEERISQEPDVFARMIVRHVNPPHEVDIAPKESVDLVLAFRQVHNWMWAQQENDYFACMFNALKPGGILGVVQHRADPGASMESMRKLHYITEGCVKDIAERAGFVFDGASDVNANPKDTKNHPNSAWSLPPLFASGDKEKYAAIGESDRMTLRFLKPAV